MKDFRAEEPPVSAEGFVQPIEEAQVLQAREEAGTQPEGSAEALARECDRLRDRLAFLAAEHHQVASLPSGL